MTMKPVKKMRTSMQKEYDVTHLKDVKNKIISKCTALLLKAFIKSRELDLPVSKLGNKASLVKHVYEIRLLPNL